MRTLTVRVEPTEAGPVGVAGSTTLAHWVEPDPGQRDHGSGRSGSHRPAGRLTVYSLVRGPWEARLARIDDLAEGLDADALRLRIAGWPVAGDGAADIEAARVTATGTGPTSSLRSLLIEVAGAAGVAVVPAKTAGVAVYEDAGPLGSPVRVPWLDHAVRPGAWAAALVELSGSGSPAPQRACRVSLNLADQEAADQEAADQVLGVRVEWPDGLSSYTTLSTRTAQGSPSGDPAAIRAR
jgi:hypothetical protein